MKIIDSHLHLFDLNAGDYQWLKPDNPPWWPDKPLINRDFDERDLILNDGLQLAGFVHVEAGFDNLRPWREVAWLEQHCQLPFRAVGCADLTLPTSEFSAVLQQLSQYRSVVGVRHILDDEAVELLSSAQCIENLAQLERAGLSFDCQLSLTDTEAVERLVVLLKRWPQLNWIINHGGFAPSIDAPDWSLWLANLRRLAPFANLALKASGWEMTARDYENDWPTQVIRQCIDTLGVSRVMLASNFPLCLFSRSYQQVWQQLLAVVTSNERNALCYANALRWYRFT